MLIKQYQTGPLGVNTYVLIDKDSKKAALIDVGGNISEIINDLKKEEIRVEFILNTHGHFDHIYGEKEAQDLYNLPVYIHKDEIILVERMKEQLQMWGIPLVDAPCIDKTFEDNEEIILGKLKIKVLHTPGHTPGGVGFLCKNILFSGDTLFCNSVGRTDLPLGNHQKLIKSIKEKFLTLPDDTKVLPGHDCETTIGDEKKYNEYLI